MADFNLSRLPGNVLSAVLTGLSTATAAAITAADSVLSALGKLQAQITAQGFAIADKEPSLIPGTKAQFYRGDKTPTMELVTTANPAFQLIKYSNDTAGAQFRFIKYRGTEAVPLAVTTNDVLMPFQTRAGYDAGGGVVSESGNVGAYVIKAAEPFTSTAQGTLGVLQCVPNGSTTLGDQYLWDDVSFRPVATNARTMGTASLRYSVTYTVNLNTSGTVTHGADLTPAQITANQNDYAPTNHATAYHFRLATDASRTVTGLQGGAAGREVLLTNVGAFDLVLAHNSTSTAANQFLCPNSASLTLNPNDSVRCRYDGTSSRWRVLGV